ACLGKGFMDFFKAADADIFCLQETKMQPGQAEVDAPDYHQYWFSAVKKGYSGTALFTKKEPLSVKNGIGIEEFDCEGRVITAEFDDFYMITVYTPNAQPELKRIDYRTRFENAFREYIAELREKKPVIVCGDMNVAHEEIDLKNPASNRGNPGFSDEERALFTELLASGMTDTFRHKYPDKKDAYSWWSYRANARANNVGWRIDYFLVSSDISKKIVEPAILSEVMGSDHCPVELLIDL
ncbi:MAG: exodeoxyribonuclease III, partial [Lachnospiraceae bacterium]|nr:exodeoxyribonuclease III [Lachnospiraceae bacterium]